VTHGTKEGDSQLGHGQTQAWVTPDPLSGWVWPMATQLWLGVGWFFEPLSLLLVQISSNLMYLVAGFFCALYVFTYVSVIDWEL
jgi:hypothetical protein